MRDKYLGTIVTTYLLHGRVSPALVSAGPHGVGDPAHTKVVVFVRAGYIFIFHGQAPNRGPRPHGRTGLNAGASYVVTLSAPDPVPIPAGLALGTWYLWVVADSGGAVPETTKGNNSAVTAQFTVF
jgi:hypothetical protein